MLLSSRILSPISTFSSGCSWARQDFQAVRMVVLMILMCFSWRVLGLIELAASPRAAITEQMQTIRLPKSNSALYEPLVTCDHGVHTSTSAHLSCIPGSTLQQVLQALSSVMLRYWSQNPTRVSSMYLQVPLQFVDAKITKESRLLVSRARDHQDDFTFLHLSQSIYQISVSSNGAGLGQR